MKPQAELSQKLGVCEYIYAKGFKSYEKAYDERNDLEACCQVSASECPRIVSYKSGDAVRWAIVLTDTALEAYL